MKNIRNPIPYKFVLDELFTLNPHTKPMFGCHAVYVNNKLVLLLRQKEAHPADNGVWVATSHIHHESLRKEFPNLRTIGLFGSSTSSWQNIAEDSPDFEESVIQVCALILKNDPRIGALPKSKKKK
jgi:hypothetical protein